MNKVVLVTGGAGYIGSNIICKLARCNCKIVCVDNFSNSFNFAINRLMEKYSNVILEQGDLLDISFIENLFLKYNVDCVIHMAGKKYVKDSFYETEEYYKNNIIATKNLLDVMSKYKVNKIIFASSISVYGVSGIPPYKEDYEFNPQSPYAEMKVEGEKMIEKWCDQNKMATILRLSNPVGANLELMLGDNSKNSNLHLLPYILSNLDKDLKFNAASIPTKDGTTIRDYIHVEDIANAFVNSYNNLKNGYHVYNIGSGEPGYSVLDMVKQIEKTLNVKIRYVIQNCREGDVPISIGDNTKAKQELSLVITKNLHEIVKSQHEFSKFLRIGENN